ncbi:MAG TPA: hypothetical protein DCR42_06345 [Flavobacteriaceae bacterium]|nr:hypothetical protein [Flavobacteriaceae bacterium]
MQNEHTICLSLAGQIQEEILEEFRVKLDQVEIIAPGYLSHKKAIELMKSADLLLNIIFSGAQKDMISGKLLEYIATEKPILSIGDPDSEAGRFLMQGTNAQMIQPDRISEIKHFLEKASLKKGQLKNTFPNLKDWSRKSLTQKLIQILN